MDRDRQLLVDLVLGQPVDVVRGELGEERELLADHAQVIGKLVRVAQIERVPHAVEPVAGSEQVDHVVLVHRHEANPGCGIGLRREGEAGHDENS
jgi:hypothetical protein